MTDIVHEEGYKDDYKVTVKLDDGSEWSPTNKELFRLVDKVFQPEEYEFGDGFGNKMLWYYISMIMIGKEDLAYDAYGLRGGEAIDHFEHSIEENAGEVIEVVEALKKEFE